MRALVLILHTFVLPHDRLHAGPELGRVALTIEADELDQTEKQKRRGGWACNEGTFVLRFLMLLLLLLLSEEG